MGPRYSPVRFQVDPLSPPPQRDPRYVLIVLGIAFVIVAVLLLVVSAIVSSAVSAGSTGCMGGTCPNVDPGPWLAWIGLPFLALGIVFLIGGL
ncbi:MAG: hypothetical protein L3J91_05815, partial [Thermoplasmata archaeon]|nr:hypothetical protein [Thermoplasmata archaeon]